MGFKHISEVALDKEQELYYKLDYITYEKQEDGKYTVNCTLFSYTERNGDLVGYAPIILTDVDIDEEDTNITRQIYIAAKKEYFPDFDDEIEED